MDLKDNKNQKPIPLFQSFLFAIVGIRTAVRDERNMRIHLVFSVIVIACSFLFSLSSLEWVFVILAIGGVISLELINTAIERVVDLITQEYHPLAKQAKDLAAAAVFVYALVAVIIGFIIFVPHVLQFLFR